MRRLHGSYPLGALFVLGLMLIYRLSYAYEGEDDGDLVDLDDYAFDTREAQLVDEVDAVVQSTKLVIASPEEDAVVGSHPEIYVTLLTQDTANFTRVFNNSYVCLSLDELPWACWPVSFARMKVADLPDGQHKLRAQLVHPWTHELLPATASEVRRFTSSSRPEDVPSIPSTPEEEDDDEAVDSDAPPDVAITPPTAPAPEPVSIDVPVLVVSSPTELGGVRTAFDVVADVHVTNMTLFQALFGQQFVCLSLDGAASICWPLAQSETHPRFLGVDEGMHTLVAALTHPFTGALITETKSARRTFVTLDTGDEGRPRHPVNTIPASFKVAPSMQQQPPQHVAADADERWGHEEAQEERRTVSREVMAVPQQQEEDMAFVGETLRPPPAAHSQGKHHTRPQQQAPRRFSAIRSEPAIQLQVDMDGTSRTLTFTASSNGTVAAREFCASNGMPADDDCIEGISALIAEHHHATVSSIAV